MASFVREEGDGDPVVLMHGLPASSFLYRKVIPELAARGFRAIAFDLPGLGFADRPADFDYTFAGLGRWAGAAVEALGLDRFHLVVHDAGGPSASRWWRSARSHPLPHAPEHRRADGPGPVRHGGLRPLRGRAGLARAAAAPGVPRRLPGRRRRRRPGHLPGGGGRLPGAGPARGRRGGVPEDHAEPPPRRPRLPAVVDSRSTPYPVQVIWGARDPVLPLRRHGWRGPRRPPGCRRSTRCPRSTSCRRTTPPSWPS